LHAESEVRWHDEFAKVLAELPDEDAGGRVPEQAGPPSEGTGDSHGDH